MKIDRAFFHPDYKPDPYWWEAARPGGVEPADPPAETEVLIVGGGYAGLSAALELARAGRAVAVVDAMDLGEGASSRNGGGVSCGINLGKGISGGPGQDGRGEDHKRLIESLIGESMAAYELVGDLIAREGIDCHYEPRGRYVGAFAPDHLAGLEKKAEFLREALDLDVSVVPRERQREEIGSDFYYGGIAIEQSAKLHPALFHRGLLAACRRAGAVLAPHTEATAIRRPGAGFEVETTRGTVKAEHVFVAVNGYVGPLMPKLRRRLVPISSQIIATEEIPEDLARSLIPKGRTISETPRVTSYYRLLPGDRRVMFGGRARFQAVPAEVSAQLLHGMMTARWPELADIRITHSWSGFVAMTTDALPHMGQEDGVHYCAGCNGSGVAMMTYLGRAVARRILAGGNSESAYARLDFPDVPVPFYSGKPWFLPIVGEYYRFLDRRDRARAAR